MPGPGSVHREGNPGTEAVVTWPRARGQDGVISSPWCYGEGNGWGQVWWTTQLVDGDFEVWAELCGSIGSRPRYFILFLHIIKSLLFLCGFIVIVESGIDQWHIDSCPIHRCVIGNAWNFKQVWVRWLGVSGYRNCIAWCRELSRPLRGVISPPMSEMGTLCSTYTYRWCLKKISCST